MLSAVEHPNGANAAGVGVNHANRHRRSDGQAHLLSGDGGKAAAAGRSRIDNALADARKVFIRQLGEPNLAEVVGIPALLVGQIGPFTGDGTDRAGLVAGGAPCQVVREVKKCRACR